MTYIASIKRVRISSKSLKKQRSDKFNAANIHVIKSYSERMTRHKTTFFNRSPTEEYDSFFLVCFTHSCTNIQLRVCEVSPAQRFSCSLLRGNIFNCDLLPVKAADLTFQTSVVWMENILWATILTKGEIKKTQKHILPLIRVFPWVCLLLFSVWKIGK